MAAAAAMPGTATLGGSRVLGAQLVMATAAMGVVSVRVAATVAAALIWRALQ